MYSTFYGLSIDNLLIINFFTYIEYLPFAPVVQGFSLFRLLFVSGLSVILCLHASPRPRGGTVRVFKVSLVNIPTNGRVGSSKFRRTDTLIGRYAKTN